MRVASGVSLTEPSFMTMIMTMVALNEAYEKLASLSEERAKHVVSLIEDLAELEARENAEDLAAARAALANPGEIISLDELEKRLAS